MLTMWRLRQIKAEIVGGSGVQKGPEAHFLPPLKQVNVALTSSLQFTHKKQPHQQLISFISLSCAVRILNKTLTSLSSVCGVKEPHSHYRQSQFKIPFRGPFQKYLREPSQSCFYVFIGGAAFLFIHLFIHLHSAIKLGERV